MTLSSSGPAYAEVPSAERRPLRELDWAAQSRNRTKIYYLQDSRTNRYTN
jgi:hypothetical protein